MKTVEDSNAEHVYYHKPRTLYFTFPGPASEGAYHSDGICSCFSFAFYQNTLF